MLNNAAIKGIIIIIIIIMLNNAAMLYPLLHSAPVRVDCGVRCFSIASGLGRQKRAGGTKQA
jgi:hypothetical protein